MTHLYAGASTVHGPLGRTHVVLTACGLRKALVFDRRPSEVVEQVGAVTCPECLARAQEGKKAP